jgi:ABC-type sugar transport system ATPase subunit
VKRTTTGITVEDLRIVLTGRDNVDVVDDIDLVLKSGEIVGLVGESGSGKTTVGTSLLGYSRAGALIERGKVLFEDRDLLGLSWQQVRQLRGEEIAYVPQDPASALTPSIRIGRQIVELMELRGLGTAASRLEGARAGLAEVGLPITVGVARTKFLAKVASGVAKPDGLLVVDPDREREFLHPLRVERLWGVGAVTARKLHGLGVHTVADVAEMHASIRRALTDRFGEAGPRMRILYGGSVKPQNARELMAVPEVNGALVGGASLAAADFLGIAKAYLP